MMEKSKEFFKQEKIREKIENRPDYKQMFNEVIAELKEKNILVKDYKEEVTTSTLLKKIIRETNEKI